MLRYLWVGKIEMPRKVICSLSHHGRHVTLFRPGRIRQVQFTDRPLKSGQVKRLSHSSETVARVVLGAHTHGKGWTGRSGLQCWFAAVQKQIDGLWNEVLPETRGSPNRAK